MYLTKPDGEISRIIFCREKCKVMKMHIITYISDHKDRDEIIVVFTEHCKTCQTIKRNKLPSYEWNALCGLSFF